MSTDQDHRAPARTRGRTEGFERQRRAIIEGAAEVFYRRGFTAGTTKEIAGLVGLSQPAIYHYVGSKRDLLEAIADHVDRELHRPLEEARSSGASAVEQLALIVTRLVEAVIANRAVFGVYLQEQHTISNEQRGHIMAREREFMDAVTEIVRTAQAAGDLAGGVSARATANGILGMVTWTYRWYRPTGPLDATAIAGVYLDLLGIPPVGDGRARATRRRTRPG